jgi:hypothetical protein
MVKAKKVPSTLYALGLALFSVGIAACTPATPPSTQAKPGEVAAVEAKTPPSEPADAKPPGKLLEESWEVMFLQGAKVGRGQTQRWQIDAPEGPRVRTESDQVVGLGLRRYGQATESTMRYSTYETTDGQLLSLSAQAALGGGSTLEAHGEVRDGLLRLTTVTEGKRSTQSLPWDEETLGYFGLEASLRRQPMKPGETRRVRWLQPLIHQISEEHLEAIAKEEVDLLHEKKRLLKIKSSTKLAGQTLETILWTDEAGNVWRSSRPAMGQESYRTTAELAKAPSESTFDLGTSTMVKLARPLENAHETGQVVYRARLKHGNPAETFPTSGSQSVRPLDDHTAEITVRRVTASEPASLPMPAAAPQAGDRQANSLIQSDDPTVRAMAQAAAASDLPPTEVAVALERYVNANLTNKNFSQAFATAADVAKSLEGDCTEHAVLLAALCRARDIPARVAAGLVYYEPQGGVEPGFAYHMWTEVWLADRWVPLDATLGRGSIGGGHLKLFDSNLDGVGALGAFLPVMNVLGQLELEIVEAE